MRPFRSQWLAGHPSDDPPRLRRGKSAPQALVLSVLSVLFLNGLGSLAGVSTAAAQSVPWHIVTSPDTSAGEINGLQSVSCTSSTSCVAVGSYYTGSVDQALIETLSGDSWSITTSPDTSTGEDNVLHGVSCTSSTSCVAVGSYNNGSGYPQTLIETLSGTTWSITTSPDTSTSEDNFLYGVSCTSSTSCVAVGSYYTGSVDQALIETLSGGSWSITTSPDTSTGEDNVLGGVSCTSSTSCVAVGSYNNGSGYTQTLIETLSGTTWSITTSPDTSASEFNELYGVSCTSSTSCVAVGYYYTGSAYQTLIETLSGTTWSITTSPDSSTGEDNFLYGVSCTSSTSCVAVGYYYNGSVYQTLILSTPLPQTITFSAPTSALFGSTLTLSATGGGSGNPVVFSLDSSSTLGACTLSGANDSVVTFTGSGNCVIDANQAGNNDYFAATEVTVKISVTYSEPCLSASHALSVRSGQAICLSPGANIEGAITVEPGGSLDIEGAMVNGSVSANGAGVVRICDSKVNGSLTISSSTGPVIIGDEALGCSGNTINGPVSITSNTDGVCFDNNTVNGPLTITGNTGSIWVTDDTVTGTENVQ
jgi:hypothetical protein